MLKRRFFLLQSVLLQLVLTAGCGALPVTIPVAIPFLVSGAGGGVAYTVTNVAYKTFSFPIKEVEYANHRALEKMEIQEVNREETEDGVRITAATKKLDIYIDLEAITPATTKVRVNAKRGSILKDKATATEIIVQTAKFLEE